MNKTLAEVRVNALRLSKADLARKLKMPLEEFERLELISSKQNKIELDILIRVSQVTNVPIDTLINSAAPKAEFKIDDNWNNITSFKQSILKYLEEGINNPQISSPDFKRKVSELYQLVISGARKPRVALVGRSDVGKSTLINSLMNSSVLPQEWTPTTSIVMFVKHIDDKPLYCKENVLIFKSGENNLLWDDTRLNDKFYTESLCLAKGDYSLLREYGARQGSRYNKTEASSAVVFVDSAILKNCDILDLPGYGTSDREEDDSLLARVKEIDILIYLSVANGFMRGEDINWLQQEMVHLAPISMNSTHLRPLSNLYIVASQAQTVSNGAHSELTKILTKAAERFESTIGPNYWTNLAQKATPSDFRKRFFTYSTDQVSLREEFEKDLKSLLKVLPALILSNLKEIVTARLGNLEQDVKVSKSSREKIIHDRAQQKVIYEKASAEAPAKLNEIENQKAEIVRLIETEYSRSSLLDFTSAYNKILTKEYIVHLIEQNNWKNKTEDKKSLCSKISNLLNDEYVSCIKRPSDELTIRINQILDNFENYISKGPMKDLHVNGGFDVKATFAGGLAGMAAYGALSVWAASLGNLGAYILVAKGVSLLAAMGISVGGTATAVSAISLIGGPIVIGVVIAALIGLVVRWLFGSSWKDSLAKKIIKEYDKQDGLGKFKSNITKYWADTRVAFIKAMDSMRDGYLEYLSNLERQIKTDDTLIRKELQEDKIRLEYLSKILNELRSVKKI